MTPDKQWARVKVRTISLGKVAMYIDTVPAMHGLTNICTLFIKDKNGFRRVLHGLQKRQMMLKLKERKGL